MEVGKIEFGPFTDPVKTCRDRHSESCNTLSKELEEIMQEMREDRPDYVVPQFKKSERKSMSEDDFIKAIFHCGFMSGKKSVRDAIKKVIGD